MYTPNAAVLIDRHTTRSVAEQPPRLRQLLHLIHAEVVRQRYSAAVIPDTVIAEVVWGDRSRWPERWQRDIKQIVGKLPGDMVEHTEWRPVWGQEHRGERARRVRQNKCPERCPLHGTDMSHRHLLVFASENLMGRLEHHTVATLQVLDRPSRQYDFNRPTDKIAAEEIKAGWQEGRMAYLHGPAIIYGPATWAELSAIELSVWQAIFTELSRNVKSSRPDRARLSSDLCCPLLPNLPHVMFAGNFRAKKRAEGHGYRIIGPTNKGWLRKAGITLPNPEQPLAIANRPATRAFLEALAKVETKFRLTAAGRLGKTWLNSEALLKLVNSRSRSEWTGLMDVTLRLYAQEDYLERILTYFQDMGGFSQTEEKPPLAVRINACPLTKKEIAKAVGITPSALSEFCSERRPWPDRVRESLETVLKGE